MSSKIKVSDSSKSYIDKNEFIKLGRKTLINSKKEWLCTVNAKKYAHKDREAQNLHTKQWPAGKCQQ